MGDISEHFDRSEFACADGCGFDAVDIELVGHLEDARHYFGVPITIDSGCRCPTHNAQIGGAPKSQHVRGKAVDIKVLGISPNTVADYFELMFPEKYGIGRYDTWTHFDVRANKSRWDLRGKQIGAES